jgi:hypothetical protein
VFNLRFSQPEAIMITPQAGESVRSNNAWRRWYSTLHPSLQLIGLQLWMPLFFILMFCLCYVAAFHAPTPHDVPVAVVGSSAQVERSAAATLPGTFSFTFLGSDADARAAVVNGSAAVAYDPAESILYVASAHQFQAANLVPALLRPVLPTGAAAPRVIDLAPLPPYDSYGMTGMYLMLAWCIGGYMTAMFIGMMGGPLMQRTRMAVIVGLGLVISAVTNILAGPVIGAIHGHFWVMLLMAWGWIVAIGLAVNGLSYFFGRFIALPAMVVFVFLSVPASGAAYPPWFMPEPFRWLNNVVVGSGITEMIKRSLYTVGPGYSRGLIMMACYAAAGLVMMLVGKRYWEARRVRRVLAGQSTMFADAQRANREFLIRDRDRILARHGLQPSASGTVPTVASVPESARRNRATQEFLDDSVPTDVMVGSETGLQHTLPPLDGDAPDDNAERDTGG